MHWVRRISIALFSILLGLFVISSVYQEYLWKQRSPLERSEEARWVATSNSWFDRDICDWFGACGIAHVNEAGWYSHRRSNKQHDGVRPGDHNFTDFWKSGRSRPEDWSKEERIPREIPRLILDHAPLVHLHSEEVFWPGDIAEHLLHTTPYLNFTPIGSHCRQLNLTSLNELNEYGRFTYTQSDDNVEDRPKWMTGDRNVPVELDNERVGGYDHALLPKAKRGGRSNAPTILVVIDKGDGIVDAFWLFFYSFNQGNKVLNIRFGNHLGDWEHTMIRFQHGEATAVFFSEHAFGAAYTYEAVEKIGKRPVEYAGIGTHAMYATPGVHKYILPLGLLRDVTNRGPLWDPTLNYYAYTYDPPTDTLRSSNITPTAPTEWFYYIGHWGDKVYPLSDPRQYRIAGQYHYSSGPLGPRFKSLGREGLCEGHGACKVHQMR